MGLLDAFLQESVQFNLWIASRSDGVSGSGTAADPFNGSTKLYPPVQISLRFTSHASGREAEATVFSSPNPFSDGDMVIITGVAGLGSSVWNGTFGIYNVLASTFNFLLSKETANPQGNPTAIRMTFEFDNVMRDVPPHTRIHLGPGIFKTRGFAPNDARGWQPKTGQKIVGAGVNVTVLQLVGAENADQHYHAVGMPIEPNGSTQIAPLEQFEISDLSIDCNMDNQPGRPDPGYGNVACGAVRILGNHCHIHNDK
jgi:hypothetical protein